MRKWHIKHFLSQILTLFFASKVNTVIVVLTIVSVLAAPLVTKYMVTKYTKNSERQPLNPPTVPVTVQVAAIPTPKGTKSLTPPPPLPDWAIAKSLPIPSRLLGKEYSQVVYNLKKPPTFRHSQKLQAIVNDVVNLAKAKGLPAEPLSITLIDAKTSETAGYQQDTLRYPASVVKMFLMVVLYAQIENGIWADREDFTPYLTKMIKESDNEATSFILDEITGTHSESELNSEKFQIWKNKRLQVNRFFQLAGYKDINISQKTFPIDYMNLSEPQGSELQMLGEPIWNWNKITTKQAARLMYEICYTGQAVSPKASKKMCELLKRDLNPKIWQKESPESEDFNPVKTLFGESLSDTNVRFYSKAGWTSIARGETAMIATGNKKPTYILAILAQDSAYANDVNIFPQMSRLVYNRMTSRSSR